MARAQPGAEAWLQEAQPLARLQVPLEKPFRRPRPNTIRIKGEGRSGNRPIVRQRPDQPAAGEVPDLRLAIKPPGQGARALAVEFRPEQIAAVLEAMEGRAVGQVPPAGRVV